MWVGVNRAAGTVAAAALAVMLSGAAPALAQDQVTANVPFPFMVGKTVMPAGVYVVSGGEDPALLAIASRDGSTFAFVLTVADASSGAVQQPQLVFRRIGDEYRLARIVMGDDLTRAIPASEEASDREADRVSVLMHPVGRRGN